MKIKITIQANNKRHEFNSATKAIKFLNSTKGDSFKMNNEPCLFRDIAELYQLELAEKRHNKAQGL